MCVQQMRGKGTTHSGMGTWINMSNQFTEEILYIHAQCCFTLLLVKSI